MSQIGEAGIEIDLDEDRHREQRDDERLRDDLLALEAEQQHQRREQRDERDAAAAARAALSSAACAAAGQHAGARSSCATITGTTM